MVRFLAFTLMALGSLPSGARSAPVQEGPAVTAGPRAWALATTAHLTYHNNSRIDRLSPDAPSDSSVAVARVMLRDWWRVHSRADLMERFDWLEREGHRKEFQRGGQTLLSMPNDQYRRALASERGDPARVRMMKIAREHFRKHRRNCLIAWDYGRYVMLCRLGYQAGYLREDEAWQRIMPAAVKIQRGFHSWQEFSEDYLIGREYWSAEAMQRDGKFYGELERWLLRDRGSPWKRLPWSMALPSMP